MVMLFVWDNVNAPETDCLFQAHQSSY